MDKTKSSKLQPAAALNEENTQMLLVDTDPKKNIFLKKIILFFL
jgi:hypothetical protein